MKKVAAECSGHADLLDGTDPVRLTGTTLLPWSDVVTVASAVCGKHIRKGGAVSFRIQLNAVANRCAETRGIKKNAGHGSCRNVDDIIDKAPSVGITGDIASQKAQTLLLGNGSGSDPRVQAQQIGNWTSILRSAARTNRRHVLHERQQVGAGC